jgi:hypothetical protein
MTNLGLQIGGGEIVQNFWFEFKTIGVKYTGMASIINCIGRIIQSKTKKDKDSELEYILKHLKNFKMFESETVNDQNFYGIFERFLNCIEAFLKTNVPTVVNGGVFFSLSFNGSTLLINLHKTDHD